MALLTAEEAYKAGKEDLQLAVQRAAFVELANSNVRFEDQVKSEWKALADQRVARGDFATPDELGREA